MNTKFLFLILLTSTVKPQNILNNSSEEEENAVLKYQIPDEYRVTNSSKRVLNIIIGTTGLAHSW